MPHVYILRCKDDSYYVGSSWNLEARLEAHNRGEGAEYTKRRLPVVLVFCEYYDRMEDAYAREKQIQGWSRAKREALINGNYESLRALSWNRAKREGGLDKLDQRD